MNATLLFGGTFDPVHVGHLRSASALLEQFDDARLIMIPSKIPPHRPQPVASPRDRFAMLQLAVEDQAAIEVDDCELDREGPSFTWDTLKRFREQLGEDAPLFFILGWDAYVTLPSWYHWQQLCDFAHLIVLERPGAVQAKPEELETWAEHRNATIEAAESEPGGSVCLVKLEQIPVSATQVREKLEGGKSIEGLVPDTVDRYIRSQHLYLQQAHTAQTEH